MLDCSTVCRRQKTLQVELSSLRTKSPLQLLVDITGIKFLGEGEWKREKHGADSRRAWRKVHSGIDAQTLEIRAIEVTSNAIGVALMLPELLTQIATDECGLGAPQRRHSRVQALGSQHLEEVERLPRRSLVETKMHCYKRLGERVTARTFETTAAEYSVE